MNHITSFDVEVIFGKFHSIEDFVKHVKFERFWNYIGC